MTHLRACELRAHLRRGLDATGRCAVEVDCDFEWQAIRRLARAVARTEGWSVATSLQLPAGPGDWPRVLWCWRSDTRGRALASPGGARSSSG